MNKQENFAMINGEAVEYNDAKLHVSDLAIQRGFGIFDFFKTIDGNVLFLDEHIDRFKNSAKELGLPLSYSDEDIKKQIEQLMHKNNLPFSGIKMMLTGGYSKDAFSLAEPNLFITQHTFVIDKEAQRNGIKVITVNHQRQLSNIKTTDYLMAIMSLPKMKSEGAQDILYYNSESITECPRSNIFIINQENEILTPEKNILSGITRAKILEFKNKGYTIKVGDIALNEVYQAKEAFMSSTTKNILPITAIDDYVIGDGKPGPLTKELISEFDKLIQEYIGADLKAAYSK